VGWYTKLAILNQAEPQSRTLTKQKSLGKTPEWIKSKKIGPCSFWLSLR